MKIERYKKDLDRLIQKGDELAIALRIAVDSDFAKRLKLTEEQRNKLPNLRKDYQPWYSEALACVRQLLPDRVEDFIEYYKPLKSRKELNASTYRISDFLQGINVTQGGRGIVGFSAALLSLEQQVQIVRALQQRFESSLFDIKTLVQADLFDNELDVSAELNKKGFSRAAGAVAGVVLEEHLGAVAQQHALTIGRHPTINDLNELLKKNGTIEIPTWRFIQRLGDLRNLCDHKKPLDPKREDIQELIEGVRKVIKTVF